ncbi:MAG: zinc metalloprotease HtpX [Parcubacteria group bacterium GW2011_GWA2_38_13b]|nr:MAG: zinc metalloprotease HtpX [Parcubacteria group bacterium GW2011_GWA2_38_13b]
MNLYTQKDSNTRKTWFLIALFLILTIGIGWVFSYAFGTPLILYIAVFISILMSFLSYWHSDKIVLAMTHAKLINHRDNLELYRIVENLCIAAGLPTPKIYIISTPALNAFATGRNPKHAVVAVTEGLLSRLDRSELEGVIAHELSHIGNRDMLVSTVVVVLVGFIVILSDFFVRWSFFGGRSNKRENGNAAAVMMIIGIFLAILAPIMAKLIQLAVSRKREFLADASGALLTRYPEGLASALEKIGRDETPMRHAGHAVAHLFIASPFKGEERTSWFTRLFMTHPLISERIKVLRELKI